MVNTIFMQEGIWDLEKLDISVSEPGFKARSAFLEISKPVLTNKIKCYLPRWFCFLVATSSKVQLRNRQIFNFNNKPNIFKKLFQYTLSIKIIILHFFLWIKSLLNSHIWLVATTLLDSVVLNDYAQLPIKTSLTTGILMQHKDTLSIRLYSTQAPHQISYCTAPSQVDYTNWNLLPLPQISFLHVYSWHSGSPFGKTQLQAHTVLYPYSKGT